MTNDRHAIVPRRPPFVARYPDRATALDAVAFRAGELARPDGSLCLSDLSRALGVYPATLLPLIAELRAAGRFPWHVGPTNAARRAARERHYRQSVRARQARQGRAVFSPNHAASLDEYRARTKYLL